MIENFNGQTSDLTILDVNQEIWTKTMNLRWVEIERIVGDYGYYEKVLQQQSVSNLGNTKWWDIKLENE